MSKKYDVIVSPDDGCRYYVDQQTGEVLDTVESGCLIIPVEQLRSRREAAERWKQLQIDRSAPPFGEFAWVSVPLSSETLPGLSAAHTEQLLYLIATMDYTGQILPSCEQHTPTVIAGHLGTYKRDAQRLISDCVQAGYLLPSVDGRFYVNSDYFYRGEIGRQRSGYFYTRMYFLGVQAVRNQTVAGKASLLHYLFRLLPCINQRYNVLCANPNEYQLDQIRSLPWSAVCERVGYSRGHAARVGKLLFGAELQIGEKRERLLIRIKGPPGQMPPGIYLNPRIFYAGAAGVAFDLLPLFLISAQNEKQNERIVNDE